MSIVNYLDEWSSVNLTTVYGVPTHFLKKYSASEHEIKNVPMLLKK